MSQWQARVDPPWCLHGWREAARAGLRARVPPEAIDWCGEHDSLLPLPALSQAGPLRATPRVSAAFVDLAASVLCHRDARRYSLLYRLLWRMVDGERSLLEIPIDAAVRRLHALRQAVHRDSHKMKAFVRFRELPGQDNHFVAWYEPDHFIVDRVAPFFARRFAGMHWAILTPERSAHWDGESLHFGPGAVRSDAPADDAGEALWRTYYRHISNPARLNPKRMQQEMPQKFWKHLPETAELPTMIRDAGAQVQAMRERGFQPPKRRIPKRNP